MIYAVDFDGTLCTDRWPEIGAPNRELIRWLKRRQAEGDKLILWTCREGERLEEAVLWCLNRGLRFDAVNDNLPEMIEKHRNNCRKVYADIYLDDKNGEVWAEQSEGVMLQLARSRCIEDRTSAGPSVRATEPEAPRKLTDRLRRLIFWEERK